MGRKLNDSVFFDNLFNNNFLWYLDDSWEQDKLFEFSQELFDNFNLNSPSWVGVSHLSDFSQQNSDVGLKIGSQEFVFLFMGGNFDTDGNSKSFFLNDFMNVLEDFNNLWHNNNLFDNFFENVRNLNKSFFM